MVVDFKSYGVLVFIFSRDMSKVLLHSSSGKLDGIFYQNKTKIPETEVSKKIKEELGLEIEPSNWRTVTTVQNIEKIIHLTILMTFADIEKMNFEETQNIVLIPTENIPNNCLPQLKWLIPLSIDVTVYGSEFNQILTK